MNQMKHEFYTKEEFNQIRADVLEFFNDDEINETFRLRKSTYDWSSKHGWRFNIEFHSNWRAWEDDNPKEMIRIVKKLFDMAQQFVEEDGRSFTMIKFLNSGNFNFEFSFKPTIIRAKELLEKTNGK